MNHHFLTVLTPSTPSSLSISGTILLDGVAMPDVTVSLGEYSATSGLDGTFKLTDLPIGTSGTLTGAKTGYTFTPITIETMSSNLTGQDFEVVSYEQQIKNVFGENLIAGWIFNETSGASAADFSGNSRAAAYVSGPTLGQDGIAGQKSVKCLSTGSKYVNLYSTSLRDAFTPGEFTIMFSCKLTNAAWSVAGSNYLLIMKADDNNYVMIQSNGTTSLQCNYKANNSNKSRSYVILPNFDGWLNVCMTVSKSNDRARVFVNGMQVGADLTGLGAWAGSLVSGYCYMSKGYDDNLNYMYVANREATPAEVLAAYYVVPVPEAPTPVFFGDSITFGYQASDAAHRWVNLVAAGKGWGANFRNSGVAGTPLQNTAQNVAAVLGGAYSPNARDRYKTAVLYYIPNWVFIMYGVNDINYKTSGNAPLYSATIYQTQLDEIVADLLANLVPAAQIVICSPTFCTSGSYATGVPAYMAACAAVALKYGCIYVDTFTPMRDGGGADLLDGGGVHPNDAGHALIANTILAAV